MRILFVSSSPINKELSVGNTFLNLFDGMENVEFASVCTRNGKIDKSVSRTFRITEKSIIRNLLKKTPVGIEVPPTSTLDNKEIQDSVPNNLISYATNKKFTIFFWLQNFIWRIGKWKSKELADFIKDYNPDLIFTLLSDATYLNKLILHIKSISKTKLAVYAWDNNYSMKFSALSPLRWIYRFLNRINMRKVVKNADVFYVISEVQKKDYEKAFKKECKVLTKSANFNENADIKKEYNNPLQLVFTGNIAMNRWRSLAIIAKALKEINSNGVLAQLKIYTGTNVTDEMKQALNIAEFSQIVGSVTADKIPEIQSNADMLIHVEPMDTKNKLLVRQSFSTKIVDYFKSARPILAVGPKDVASIDHLIKNDCAIVADNKQELIKKLTECINNNNKLTEIAVKGYECGKKHHNKENIDNMLIEDLRIR